MGSCSGHPGHSGTIRPAAPGLHSTQSQNYTPIYTAFLGLLLFRLLTEAIFNQEFQVLRVTFQFIRNFWTHVMIECKRNNTRTEGAPAPPRGAPARPGPGHPPVKGGGSEMPPAEGRAQSCCCQLLLPSPTLPSPRIVPAPQLRAAPSRAGLEQIATSIWSSEREGILPKATQQGTEPGPAGCPLPV